MAEGFHFMFGMCKMILLLPTALILEMVGVPKFQVKSPGATDTAKTCVAGHTGKLMPVNELGKTISNKFPGWILCRVLCTPQLFETLPHPEIGFNLKNYIAYSILTSTNSLKWILFCCWKGEWGRNRSRREGTLQPRSCWGGSLEVWRNPNHAAPPGNSMAELEAGTQDLWGWEINFRWLWNFPPR